MSLKEVCGVTRGECSPYKVFDETLFLWVELIKEGKHWWLFFSAVHMAVCLSQVIQADMWNLHVWLFSNNKLHSWRMRLNAWRFTPQLVSQKTIVFRLSGPCGEYLQFLNSWRGSESEETFFGGLLVGLIYKHFSFWCRGKHRNVEAGLDFKHRTTSYILVTGGRRVSHQMTAVCFTCFYSWFFFFFFGGGSRL